MNKHLIMLLFFSLTPSIYSKHMTKAFDDFEHFDDLFAELDKETELDTDWDPSMKRCNVTDCDAVQTIQSVNGIDLLSQNIYIHTNPVNKRPLNDFPEFSLHYYTPLEDDHFWHFKTDIFANKTDQAFFTQESTFIRSYVALDEPDLIQTLDDIELDGINIPDILALFKNVKLEERRAGLMASAIKFRKGWFYEVRAPVIWQERNFFVNAAEQRAIDNSGFFNSNEDEAFKFARKHLISDRFGLDDTRATIGYTFVDDGKLWLNAGLQTTFPTGLILCIHKGYLGTHFDKSFVEPVFNIVEFLNLSIPNTPCYNPRLAQQEGVAFFEAALDRLSAMVVEDSLGNGGHLGIGLYEEHHLKVSSKLTMRSRAALEYLIPNWEKRFYIQQKDQAAFDAIDENPCGDPESDAAAQRNLNYLEQQLTETFFPAMYKTFISPGFIFNWNGALCGSIGKHWTTSIGYDLWVQQQEHQGTIKASPETLLILKKKIARKPSAYQNKIFFVANYYSPTTSYDWGLDFGFDTSFGSSGIGENYLITIGCRILL